MTTARWLLKRAFYGASAFLAIGFSYTGFVHAAPINEKEALEIAEFWYPAEVNFYDQKGWKRQGNESKSDLLASAKVATVRYLVDKDTVVDQLKGNQEVLAYIVDFSPRGYLVLSADDSITPLLAFNLESEFSLGNPDVDKGHTYQRFYFNQYVDNANTFLNDNTGTNGNTEEHPGWSKLRTMSKEQKNLAPEKKSLTQTASPSIVNNRSRQNIVAVNRSKSIFSGFFSFLNRLTSAKALAATNPGVPNPSVADILMPTAMWYQFGHYNGRNDAGGVTGVQSVVTLADPSNPPPNWNPAGGDGPGDGVPTGCNATALAIILRYHEWPNSLNGSHTWLDTSGNVRGTRTINSGNTSFNWSNMPTGDIDDNIPPTNPPTPIGPNNDIANLMLTAGVLCSENWEVDATPGANIPQEWNDHLRYKYAQNGTAYSNGNPPEANCMHAMFGGHDYFFCPNSKKWADARSSCAGVDAYLVRIDTDEENNFIASTGAVLFPSWGPDTWIGAKDNPNEGSWQWADNYSYFWEGGPASSGGHSVGGLYSNWDPSQPDNLNNAEDCAEEQINSFWFDRDCSIQFPYVCERPVNSLVIQLASLYSLARGLPVSAGISFSNNHGHAVVIDGYRNTIPVGDPPDTYWHVNDGWGFAPA